MASRSCCRFVGSTSMMQISVPPHPKVALLDWDLVNMEAIGVRWTHCHLHKTRLRWFELCDICITMLEVAIRRWVDWSYTGRDQQQYSGRLWSWNDALLVLRGPKCVAHLLQGETCCAFRDSILQALVSCLHVWVEYSSETDRQIGAMDTAPVFCGDEEAELKRWSVLPTLTYDHEWMWLTERCSLIGMGWEPQSSVSGSE